MTGSIPAMLIHLSTMQPRQLAAGHKRREGRVVFLNYNLESQAENIWGGEFELSPRLRLGGNFLLWKQYRFLKIPGGGRWRKQRT